jgi:crotonobetainyl-CoA:carnitine CoA-transferase CaiB-like acyl-CoA transferase
MSLTPPIVGRPAPLLGEHTVEVLQQAGCDAAQIKRIVSANSLR